jgi:two-component system sensor histidine kinase VicK
LISLNKHPANKIIIQYWWLYIFLLIPFACKQKNTESGRYTEAFIIVLNKATPVFDNKPEAGLKYLDSAFREIPNPSYGDKFRYLSFHYVYHQKIKHDHQKGVLYADSMMMMANKTINEKYYVANFAEANFAKGDALFDLNQFNESFQCYYQGYLAGKNDLNNEALSDYTYRMGMIMYKKAHYKAAANYFKESFQQKSLTPDNNDFAAYYRKQELLDNIGLSHKHNNDNDSALVYFNKTLKFLDDNAHRFPDRKNFVSMAHGVVYGNKAEVYIQEQAYGKAIDLLKKSIAINLQKGFDNVDAQFSEIKLGKIYLEQKEYGQLKTLLTDLRGQLDTVKNDASEAEWHRLMGSYYEQKNDLKSAIAHIQQYNHLKDSIAKSASLLLESDVNEQLANYEKAHQIEQLSENNKLQKIYLYVIIVFALMALIIIFLIYRNWRISKKDVMTVNVLNAQINEQNAVLEKALSELNVSSQEKDRILRTVAHDLRNPIGGIASLTSIMVDDEFTDEQKELINLVKETSYNSLELINEILEATNITSIELNLELVEINSLVSNSVELLRFKAAEKGQQIFFEPLDRQQELYISREKIWRVISNLVSNAIKFSPTGASIFIKIEKQADQAVIAVKDNGIGIPEKLRDQVFNMFTSAQRPGTAGEKSFGLGLSICRQIMEKSNGKIWFESNSTQGTTFYISLPLPDAIMPTDSTQQISIPLS